MQTEITFLPTHYSIILLRSQIRLDSRILRTYLNQKNFEYSITVSSTYRRGGEGQ